MHSMFKSSHQQDSLARAGNTLSGLLRSAADAIGQGKSTCEARLGAGRDAVTGYTRDKPLVMLGAAALAGIAVGLLLMRR